MDGTEELSVPAMLAVRDLSVIVWLPNDAIVFA
jgi:hypothetical protein